MASGADASTARPTAYFEAIDKNVGRAFDRMRDAVMKSGPMDETMCELIITPAMAAVRNWHSFRTHAKRLVVWGVPRQQIYQSIVCCMGASLTFPQALEALKIVDELFDEVASQKK